MADAVEVQLDDLQRGLEQYQQRTAELVSLLPAMRAANHPRLNSALDLAHRVGYTLDQLGSVMGLSCERIRQRILAGDPVEAFRVSPEDAARLLDLRRDADGRNPAKRDATARYRAFLADLRQRGATLHHLADLLGVTHGAVNQHLKKHDRDEAAA